MTKYKPLIYGSINVRPRHDKCYCVYVTLNYSDLGLVSADDAYNATMHNLPYLNPLKWVQVAVAKSFDLAKEEATRWKRSLKAGLRPTPRSDLITRSSST